MPEALKRKEEIAEFTKNTNAWLERNGFDVQLLKRALAGSSEALTEIRKGDDNTKQILSLLRKNSRTGKYYLDKEAIVKYRKWEIEATRYAILKSIPKVKGKVEVGEVKILRRGRRGIGEAIAKASEKAARIEEKSEAELGIGAGKEAVKREDKKKLAKGFAIFKISIEGKEYYAKVYIRNETMADEIKRNAMKRNEAIAGARWYRDENLKERVDERTKRGLIGRGGRAIFVGMREKG